MILSRHCRRSAHGSLDSCMWHGMILTARVGDASTWRRRAVHFDQPRNPHLIQRGVWRFHLPACTQQSQALGGILDRASDPCHLNEAPPGRTVEVPGIAAAPAQPGRGSVDVSCLCAWRLRRSACTAGSPAFQPRLLRVSTPRPARATAARASGLAHSHVDGGKADQIGDGRPIPLRAHAHQRFAGGHC